MTSVNRGPAPSSLYQDPQLQIIPPCFTRMNKQREMYVYRPIQSVWWRSRIATSYCEWIYVKATEIRYSSILSIQDVLPKNLTKGERRLFWAFWCYKHEKGKQCECDAHDPQQGRLDYLERSRCHLLYPNRDTSSFHRNEPRMKIMGDDPTP